MAGLDFVIEDGTLKEYTGSDEHVVIPEGVTSIGKSAFHFCESLTSVVIPEGVTSIGDSAFSSCENLASVVIPEGVTSIGKNAFDSCESLTSIVIPDSVTSIGEAAFRWCSRLTSIVIPSRITCIECATFAFCAHLKKVVLPSMLETIKGHDGNPRKTWYGAFEGCERLAEIHIPASVKSIEHDAFGGCDRLHLRLLHMPLELFDADMKRMMVFAFFDDPTVYSEDQKAAYIAYIGKQKKRLLLHAVMHNNVVPFIRCEELGIKLPPALRDELIEYARKEKKVTMLARLMDYKQRTGDRKKEEAAKERVQEQQLMNPYMDKFLKAEWTWTQLDDGTMRIDRYKGKSNEVIIPAFVNDAPVTTLSSYMFSRMLSNQRHSENTTIESITVPASVVRIEPFAFFGCRRLKTVTLPDSVVSIGVHAFYPEHIADKLSIIASDAVSKMAQANIESSNRLKGMAFVVTGNLSLPEHPSWGEKAITFSKSEAEAFIRSFGGMTGNSVSESIACVITHRDSVRASQVTKANKLGVPVMTLEQFVSQYFPEGIPT